MTVLRMSRQNALFDFAPVLSLAYPLPQPSLNLTQTLLPNLTLLALGSMLFGPSGAPSVDLIHFVEIVDVLANLFVQILHSAVSFLR